MILYVTDDLVNRYTAFTTATPRSLEFVESYLSTSKNQYASNVINKKEDTRFAEPDPSLRPFFQFLLNSTKRKKRNLTKPSDSRIVENFINYSINNLQNPVGSDTLGSMILMHNTGQHSSYKYEPETQYLPVPIYSKIPKPKPIKYDSSLSDSISGSIYQTSTQDPYKNWQETPLIFPDSNKKPPITRPPFVASDNYQQYQQPNYNVPNIVNEQSPTFITPIELQSPTFITPIEYQGPTFVTPISITQSSLSDGNPPPTIVILEDIDTIVEPPLNDPIVEQDPVAAGGSGGASPAAGGAAAAVAAGGAAAVLGAIGAGAGAAGIAGGAAVAVAVGAGGGGGVGGGGGGVGGTLTPADEAQCRSGGGASKVCSELITTSSSPSSSGFISFLEDLIYLFTSINFIGPLMITFWSIIFPPMSIILTSGLGVISFLFPWILPRLWFGRQLTHNFNVNQFHQRLDNTNNYHQPYYYY